MAKFDTDLSTQLGNDATVSINKSRCALPPVSLPVKEDSVFPECTAVCSVFGGWSNKISIPHPSTQEYPSTNARGLVKVKRCRASTRGDSGGSTDSTDSSTDDGDDAIAGFESVNDRDGSTALIMAVTEGDVEGARALLEVAGADPN